MLEETVLETYVKSPVASLCLACSSVRKRVRVTMSVLTFSFWTAVPFVAMMKVCEEVFENEEDWGKRTAKTISIEALGVCST
jgi:hypothetical protein